MLGQDPETSQDVSLKKGPYGVYVQLGEPEEGSKAKPKRASLPKQVSPADIDLQKGLALLSLPRPVGEHPETKELIEAGIGRYGPYLKHAGAYVSLPGDDTVLTIGLNHAVQIIAEKGSKKKPGRSLGDHPADGKPVTVQAGRYGPYAQHGSIRATLPKGEEMETVTLERAVELLTAKAEKSGKGAPKKTAAKKPAAKKAPAKKAAPKKTATKSAAAKKSPAKKKAASKSKADDGDSAGTPGS